LTQALYCVMSGEDPITGAIPAASTLSAQASTGDGKRHIVSEVADPEGVVLQQGRRDLRQVTTANVGSRPPRATESATGPLFDDPALAAVVAAWPHLPDILIATLDSRWRRNRQETGMNDPNKALPLAVDGTGVGQLQATTAGAPARAGRARGPFRNRPSHV
jgi:hypothetical protein